MSGIRVAMIAPPWLSIPPKGYGGIENMLSALVWALQQSGVEVELFTTGDSSIRGIKKHWLYDTSQYAYMHRPQYDAAPIAAAHILFALNKIRKDGDFDIIHDHNNFYGPLALAHATADLPPAIHTTHNPRFDAEKNLDPDLQDNKPMWRQLGGTEKLYFVGISESQIKNVPQELASRMLRTVHNGLMLKDFPFAKRKENYFMTIGRLHPEKGQHVAVKACVELHTPLRMVGVIGDITSQRKLIMELANPLSKYRSLDDFRYYSDRIFPYQDNELIQYLGEVSTKRKIDLVRRAKALLFPVQWDEPFGMAPIEALACGTPVIAMARGALPEIIEHGVNGFLAKNPTEFKHYMTKVDEIDPAACRASVRQKFSAEIMAKKYLEHYKTIIKKHAKTSS